MFYAAVSLDFYNGDPQNLDTTKLAAELRRRYTPFHQLEGTHFETAFGHLNGYSAVYYTYMWSLVIAKDMFTEFKSSGMLNLRVAAKYRQTVLAPSGTEPAADAARLIMTGQAQIQNMSQAQFQQAVCARAVAMFSCPGLYVNVQTFQSFSGVSLLDPLQNGNFNANALNYNLGGPGSIVMLQVFYEWPIPTNIGGIGLANMSGNNRLMMATAVFRSEPY